MKILPFLRETTAALLLQLFAGLLAAQPVKLCIADEDSIAIASSIAEKYQTKVQQKYDRLNSVIQTRTSCFHLPSDFSTQDSAKIKIFQAEIARLETENERVWLEAEFMLETYQKAWRDTLLSDIRSKIALVAKYEGCTAVFQPTEILWGEAKDITQRVVPYLAADPMICRRWQLPDPQQRAIFFFLPMTPLPSIFFR